MDFEFSGELFEWRGPAPYVYVAMPAEESEDLAEAAPMLTYGWGCIPVTVTVGATTWTTALFPKDGRYLVPIKLMVQRAEAIGPGDHVRVSLTAGRE